MREPLAHQMEDAKYGIESTRKIIYFNALSPPYFSGAVRSFGEYRAERDEIRPRHHSGSQEVCAKKPANTGYFCRWNLGERDLPEGRMAEGTRLRPDLLWLQLDCYHLHARVQIFPLVKIMRSLGITVGRSQKNANSCQFPRIGRWHAAT